MGLELKYEEGQTPLDEEEKEELIRLRKALKGGNRRAKCLNKLKVRKEDVRLLSLKIINQ